LSLIKEFTNHISWQISLSLSKVSSKSPSAQQASRTALQCVKGKKSIVLSSNAQQPNHSTVEFRMTTVRKSRNKA